MAHRRLDHIDALRGFAAMSIVVFHLRVIASGAPLRTPDWVVGVTDRVFDAGVPLFFALSGFLLTMLAPSYGRHRHPTASFYLKRFFRIAPLFYAVILLNAWLAGSPPAPGRLLANVTFTFNLIPAQADSAVFAGWTIGVEMLFYAAFPFIHPMLSGLTLKAAALAGSIALAGLVDAAIAGSGLDPRYTMLNVTHSLPLFLMGMIAFDLSLRLRVHPRRREIAVLLLACAALVFDLILTQRTVLVLDRYWQGLACGLVVLAFAVRPFAVANAATAFLGRISYSMYLLHGLVIGQMGHAFLAPYRWGLPPLMAFAAAAAIALLAIVPVAWVSFELIEVPGNRLGAAAVRWLDARSTRRARFGDGFYAAPAKDAR